MEALRGTPTESKHDIVLRAAARSYELDGLEALAVPDQGGSRNGSSLPDLLIPALRRVEEIETDETIPDLNATWYKSLRDRGLEVWVVVPLASIGEIQTRLTGFADRIQPWWEDAGRIRFGNPRHL